MKGLAVAELAADQIERVVALWTEAGLTRPWNDPYDDARLALAGPSSTILAGWLDSRLAASVMVGWDGHRGAVYYLAVADAFRGRGYGEAMMQAAEAWLVRFDAPKINLMIRSDNAPVLGFYEAIGYADDPVSVRSKRLRP